MKNRRKTSVIDANSRNNVTNRRINVTNRRINVTNRRITDQNDEIYAKTRQFALNRA